MVKKQYPEYILATDHISHYRDMKLVTFAVDRVAHYLIVSFPVFIKDYRQLTLAMYEIESVPIPLADKKYKGKQLFPNKDPQAIYSCGWRLLYTTTYDWIDYVQIY